jgi:hypothetical protein
MNLRRESVSIAGIRKARVFPLAGQKCGKYLPSSPCSSHQISHLKQQRNCFELDFHHIDKSHILRIRALEEQLNPNSIEGLVGDLAFKSLKTGFLSILVKLATD